MADPLDEAQDIETAEREHARANRQRYEGDSATECIECGEAIPEGRRRALPGIETCVYCAELDERL